MKKPKGWKGESRRHSLASRGIKTVQAIPRLSVQNYLGRWYQIKAIPRWYQEGCNNVVAQYSKGKDFIKVTNSCFVNGKLKRIEGKAYPINEGKSKLEVDFVGGRIFTGDYWVLHTDYNVALVGTPDKESLWILSRSPKIAKKDLKKLEQIAVNQGFDIRRLKK